MNNNAVVFWLKKDVYDIRDAEEKTMSLDDLIENLTDIRNYIGGDAKVFIGDQFKNQYDKNFGTITQSKIVQYYAIENEK